MTESFPLAPMSPGIRWLTLGILVITALLLLPWSRVNEFTLVPGGLMAAICLLVWLWFRPTRFEIGPGELSIVWPARRESIPLAGVSAVETVTGEEFRARYGWAMRIGAGGLWGGFGLLRTRKEMLRFYISRLDGYVLVHRREGRTFLLTPAEPERFVATLRERMAA